MAQKPRRSARSAVIGAPADGPAAIGARLRQLRVDRGESPAQAASSIGCAGQHLRDIEGGKSANPGLQLLRSLARHYGVTVAYIIGEASQDLS